MDKIFKQAKDKNVAKVIIYGHTDNLLYSDSGHTNKLDKVSLKDLFVKGCVVKTESEDLLPVKYFETDVYAGFILKSDDSIDIYYSKEYTPEPSGISIIPINSYTTEDTGYGDGFLDITAIVPPVVDETVLETYSAAIVAALADDSLDNINHTITIGNQTLTDQIASYDETNEIVYLGNLSLYDDSAEDTGEDWFLIVSSTLELTTRTPMTINFGMSYEVEEPEEEVIYEKTLTFVKETDTISDVNDNDTQYDTLGLISGSKYTLIVGDNDYSMIGLEQQGIVALVNEDYETAGMLNAVSPSTDGGIKVTITSQEAFSGDRLVKIVKSAAPTPSEHTFEGELTFAEPEEGSDYYQAILPNTVILAPKNYIITIDEDASITLIHSYNSEAQAHIYVDENNKVMMASVLVEGQTYSTVGLNKSGYSATVHNIILDEVPAPSET